MKVVVAGPPHSGKSVFLGGLCQCLPRDARYLFRACPDGEGTWTWRNEAAAAFRKKGSFTPQIVNWYCRSLAHASLAPIVLVDIGGRLSPENRRILVEGKVEYGIILSGNLQAISEWQSFLEGCGVEVIAKIHSDYHGTTDITDAPVMSVHHLERGEDVSSRPVIKKIAAMLLDMATSQEEERKDMKTIKVTDLAEMIGKKEGEVTLPNGRVVKQMNWSGEDLREIARVLHNTPREKGAVIDVDGAGPAWLMAAIVHELHPASVRLNSADGFVGVGCQKPEGAGKGQNLVFTVECPDRNGWWTVYASAVDPSVPFAPSDLDQLTPPQVPMGAKVIISGRLPNWMTASLAMAYHGIAAAVACYQPGVGATVCWTHSQSVQLGDLVK